MRIGIDVGGTHTDAVILSGDTIVGSTKALTSADVITGVKNAMDAVLDGGGVAQSEIEQIMIGTTQFTNAVIQRRDLAPTAVIRISLPSGRGLPPMLDWPDDIADAVGQHHYLLSGGYLYDGRPLAPLDDQEIDAAIADIGKRGLSNIAISSAFSPVNHEPELYVANRLRKAIPNAHITLSHQFGRLGLVERENAAILNTTLLPFAQKVVDSFLGAIKMRGLECPIFISQNDGTLMSADFVRDFPALTFASGPTNSLRGACKLTGLDDAIVVDIGGTTSDIGVLQHGFPRESNVVVDIGGVRTNFRMPDILAIGLGGGSLVEEGGKCIGPLSVGHNLVTEGLVFGGSTLTTTDILVASGQADVGDSRAVANLDSAMVKQAQETMQDMLNSGIERMKPSDQSMPVVLVGGGAILVTRDLNAASSTLRPENAGVANAIGAAIAQIGGESERLVSYRQTAREDALAEVTANATRRAVVAGADATTIRVADIEETAIPYMDEGSTRLRVKVIGDISPASSHTGGKQ